jgi:hypothetical protein
MDQEQLYAALSKRAGFEVVNTTGSQTQLRVLGRVQGSENTARWLLVVERLLVKAAGAPWSIDISKQYFLRGEKLLYGWRVILQAPDLAPHFDAIVAAVNSTPARVAVVSDEVPLNASPNRNALRNGKGAQGVLTAVVGPGARTMGG